MDKKRKQLLELIFTHSFRYDPLKGFRLSSGRMSDVYIDLKNVTTTSEGAWLIGEIIYDMIKDLPVNGVGGLTLGADPIAYATMLVGAKKGKPVNVFMVRKTAKSHGTKRTIEGTLKKGDNVVIFDDVVTTGSSTVEAITKSLEAGFNIIKVISIVDREEGGAENIRKYVSDYSSVFTKSDLLGWLSQSANTLT